MAPESSVTQAVTSLESMVSNGSEWLGIFYLGSAQTLQRKFNEKGASVSPFPITGPHQETK